MGRYQIKLQTSNVKITAVFMSLDHSKGEAFGQLIIGFYLRLSSKCFAPTLLTRNLNQNVVYLPENSCNNSRSQSPITNHQSPITNHQSPINVCNLADSKKNCIFRYKNQQNLELK
jgi:hypothetical protein